MIATTKSGFEAELNDDALNDMELLDDLAAMQSNNILSMPRVVHRLLGADGTKKLYDHLRTEDGRVPVDAVGNAIGELLASFAAGKNSSSSPN